MEKDVLIIAAKYLLKELSSSGITLIFLIPTKEGMGVGGVYSTVIPSDECFKVSIPEDSLELVRTLYNIRAQFGMMPGTDQKIHDAVMRGITFDNINTFVEKIEKNDTASIAYEIKKIIGAVLASDDNKFEIKPVYAGKSIILFNDAYERMQTFTPSKKVDIAAQFYDNDKTKAELSLKNNSMDISIVALSGKGVFVLIYINNQTGKFVGYHTGAMTEELIKSRENNIVDLFHMTKPVENPSLEKMLATLTANAKASMFIPDADNKPAVITERLKSIGINDLVCINYDTMNCVVAESLFQISANRKDAASGEHGETEARHIKKTINVALVLSPTKGKRLTELAPGNIVQVILDKNSPIGLKFIKNLNLLDDNNTVKPLGSEVYAVKRDAKGGFTVYVKLTGDLYGKTYEETDVRIKAGDPEIDELISRSNSSLTLGLIIGLVVIIIGVIVMILL